MTDDPVALLRKELDKAHLNAYLRSRQLNDEIGRCVAAENEVKRLRAQVAAVRTLHQPVAMFERCPKSWHGCDDEHCEEDIEMGGYLHTDMPREPGCAECRIDDGEPADWPCATIRALGGSDEV